jgi:hypothetical protein
MLCSVETLSGERERRRRRPLPGAVGQQQGLSAVPAVLHGTPCGK